MKAYFCCNSEITPDWHRSTKQEINKTFTVEAPKTLSLGRQRTVRWQDRVLQAYIRVSVPM
jgi:hypothetical protein